MPASDSESVTSQSSTTRPVRPKKYLCDFEGCTKAYTKPSLLEQHKRSHSGERPFKCSYEGCEKSFLRKSHLDTHRLSHTGSSEKPYHCSICGKGVNSPQHLKRHEVTHTKSFKCPHEGCEDVSFYKHQSLRHHILSVHDKTLMCKICDKTFPRPYRLAQHNIKFHSESPAYQCDHTGCFKNFKTWSALQLHIKSEHPKLKCSICGKGCVGTKGLKSHMITHDETKMAKIWNCVYCDLGKFPKKLELIEHYNALHDGNIPEDLLKNNERLRLQELLNETDEAGIASLKDLKKYEVVQDQNEETPEEEYRGETTSIDSRSETPKSAVSINTLNTSLKSGNKSGKGSIINLISDNYHLKKLPCPKKACDRRFNRKYDLDRHLKWHEAHLKKIESFLDSLDTEIEQPQDDEPQQKKRRIHVQNAADLIQEDDVIQEEVKNIEVLQKYDENDYDDNLDSLIDEELRSLTAGGSVD